MMRAAFERPWPGCGARQWEKVNRACAPKTISAMVCENGQGVRLLTGVTGVTHIELTCREVNKEKSTLQVGDLPEDVYPVGR